MPELPPYLWLPLLSAVIYAFASTFLKRALESGAGMFRGAFVANLVLAALTAPGFFWGGWPSAAEWGVIAVITAVAFAGQLTNFLALRLVDASVATPLMGTKVLFVAVFAVALAGAAIPALWWVAAGLSTAALYLLSRSPKGAARVRPAGIAAAVASAACFALGDVLVQQWVRGIPLPRFVPASTLLMAVYSLGLIPLFNGPLRSTPPRAAAWVVLAAALIAVQWVMLIYAFTVFQQVTASNIAYNSRGLWAVVVVMLVGRALGVAEGHLPRALLLGRLAGALLVLAAIALVALAPR